MKSVVYSWHDGISGPRLAAQFGENTRHLRDGDADDVDNSEEVQRVADLASKDCKSLPKTLLSLSDPDRGPALGYAGVSASSI